MPTPSTRMLVLGPLDNPTQKVPFSHPSRLPSPQPCRHSLSQLSEVFFSVSACSPACLQTSVPVSQQNPAILIPAAAAAALSHRFSPSTSPSPSQEGKEGLGRTFLNRQEGTAAPEGCSLMGDTAQMWQARVISPQCQSLLSSCPVCFSSLCSSHSDTGLCF